MNNNTRRAQEQHRNREQEEQPADVMLLPYTTFLFLFLLHLNVVGTQNSPPPSPLIKKPPQALLNAVETLSNSGYNAMALTLQLILTDPSISLHSTAANSSSSHSHPSLTIFVPPDTAFVTRGQPSLNLLLRHFSPLSLSRSSLSSFPFATKIPSLSPSDASLFVTSSGPDSDQVSINNVKVVGSPLYDDGSVIAFAVEDFFDPNFKLIVSQDPRNQVPECVNLNPFSQLYDASAALKSRGYSIMASFLDLQILGFVKNPSLPLKLTIFAPEDEILIKYSGNFVGYSSLFLRHLLCRWMRKNWSWRRILMMVPWLHRSLWPQSQIAVNFDVVSMLFHLKI